MALVNCSSLASRTSFDSYAHKLLNATNGNLSLLDQCRNEVCVALWGDGNGDISGIGVIVGYALDHFLGLSLSLTALYCASRKGQRAQQIVWSCFTAFSDSAIIFAIAIEIAATLVLIREDFGKSTNGMGDDTVRITQSVSMIVLLALLYPILAFRMQTQRVRSRAEEEDREPQSETLESSIRFGQFVLCWLLAFYPFYSAMNAAFGPSRIGNKSTGHAVLSPTQFAEIQHVCFGRIKPITVLDDQLMTACVMLTYFPISLFVVGTVLRQGVRDNHPDSRLNAFFETCRRKLSERFVRFFLWGVYGTIPLLGCGLLWCIIHTRLSQEALTASYGGSDSDNEWTFGQIVALTVFAPVAVEGYKTYRSLHQGDESFSDDEDGGSNSDASSPTATVSRKARRAG